MNKEHSGQTEYTKPKILDLGKMSIVFGASCVPDGEGYYDECEVNGASPESWCGYTGQGAVIQLT